ncbi:conserved hypothetical protein [Neospora caninum Liverpool]|uniref:GPI-anchored wall transfer protein 1 n=1 Tax=Neospora caninum (strain Liverpool) TaxID=572307 RepID=F0VL17_NEOCL|nr:conserved hypothetical protein [Neospora caninum Liverpool]CBZ54769.1 conserved hypothetical protein [Neospora caninum Liverpool]CEL69486.1 TPA: GPI-anchored wall transfer protein 1 [Neospora caninum Liverpool]|eukprot:XP_003884797.1 conserved hypothetical protein [Neospora caninum Liverpool]
MRAARVSSSPSREAPACSREETVLSSRVPVSRSSLVSSSLLRNILLGLSLSSAVALLLLLRLPLPATRVTPSPSSSLPASLSLVHPLLPFFSLNNSPSLPRPLPSPSSPSSSVFASSLSSLSPWWSPWFLSAGPAWWFTCPADTAPRSESLETPKSLVSVEEGTSSEPRTAPAQHARWEHHLPEAARQALARFAQREEAKEGSQVEAEKERTRRRTCSDSAERGVLYQALQEAAFSNNQFPPFLEVLVCVTLLFLTILMYNAFSRFVAAFSAWRSQVFFLLPPALESSSSLPAHEGAPASPVLASSVLSSQLTRGSSGKGTGGPHPSPCALDPKQKSCVASSPARSPVSLLLSFLVDFCLLVLPTLTGFCLPNALFPVSFAVVTLTAALVLSSWILRGAQLSKTPQRGDAPPFETDNLGHVVALGEYRGILMIATCIAISGVDFFVFPRSLAKTSTSGVSLMDLGIGCFIFGAGLVSPQARAKANIKSPASSRAVSAPEPARASDGEPGRGETPEGEAESRDALHRLKFKKYDGQARAVKTALRVVGRSGVLGIVSVIRLVAVSLVNYYTPVTEYGKHWNFYMSLMILFLAAELLLPEASFSALLYVPVGVAVAAAYQLLLWVTDAETWVLTARRDNFFTANREGILGCAGFFSLYMIGAGVGSLIFRVASASRREENGPIREREEATKKSRLVSSPPSRFTLIAVLLGAAVCFYLYALVFAFYLDLLPMRRLINLPWVLLVAALNVYGIAGLLLSDVLLGRGPSGASYLLVGLSQNQIFIFLIANVLCGVIGLSVDTLLVSPAVAFGLLFLYGWSWAFVAFLFGYSKKRIPLSL